ncbi:MAG TPA: hypothetical protein VEB87_05510 [Nitrososphaerales archaeon]|nr:hypothetical protein [Nitrososphaerales archaeon]
MSVLLRRWVCLDEGQTIASEDEYCFHASVYPKHRIVVCDNTIAEQWHPRSWEIADAE